LGVGTAGENEVIDFDSHDDLVEDEFLTRMNAALPPGLRFKRLERLAVGALSLIKIFDRAEYSVALGVPEIEAALGRSQASREDLIGLSPLDVQERLVSEFLSRESWVIERVRKDKRQKVDVRRYTQALGIDRDMGRLLVITQVSPNGGVKPVEV